MTRTSTFAAVGALTLAAGAASAGMMQVDFSNISVATEGGAAFTGTDFTGTLELRVYATDDASAHLLLDGNAVGEMDVPVVYGVIDFVSGGIVSGFFIFTDGDYDAYAASIGAGGGINAQAGQGFSIDGITLSGQFGRKDTGPANPGFMFGPVDVFGAFGSRASDESLDGSFLLTSFNPDENGIDDRVGFDVFIAPTPGTVALAGLAGIAVVRRKR